MTLPVFGVQGVAGLNNDELQSFSLSEKQKNLFLERKELGDNIFEYTYERQEPSNKMKIVRYAIGTQLLPTDSFSTENFILLEKKVFEMANELLKKSESTDCVIQNRSIIQQSPPNNVVLVDIFATIAEKTSNNNQPVPKAKKETKLKAEEDTKLKVEEDAKIKVKKDANRKGSNGEELAETHTICLWKKSDTQIMIIDPSNSSFSMRIEKCAQPYFQNKYGRYFEMNNSPFQMNNRPSLNYKIVEHPGNKFYEVSQGTKFNEKSKTTEKRRDCIDVALKIAVVLNQGALIYGTVQEVEHSINLLSNQPDVNPILTKALGGTFLKGLQSTKREKRCEAIQTLLCIPREFKDIFNYSDWIEFKKRSHSDRENILKILRIFNAEIKNAGFANSKDSAEIKFTSLLQLENCYTKLNSLNDELAKIGFSVKLAGTSSKK